MKYEEGTSYVLTAPRCRPAWREPVGNTFITRSKRFKRGEVLEGIPEEQVARLVEMGHAVPEDEWDPEEFRKMSAARRLAMQTAAAADAAAAVAEARARQNNGQPVVGLEDAEERTSDGVKIEDVDGLGPNGERPAASDAGDGDDNEESTPADDYESKSFAELQRLAKDRTGNGGGSTEELIARLREHDAQQ